MPAAKLFSFFFLFITDCPPQGAQSRVCTRAKRIKGKSISFDALSRSTPPSSSSSSSLLTSCPSTRGEWIQKFPSVGKVRDCVGSNEGVDENRDIIQRSIFFFFGITEGNRYPRSVNGGGGFEQGGGFLMWME